MSAHGIFRAPAPVNEPVKSYGPGSPEREELRLRLAQLQAEQLDIPLVIGGEEVRTGVTVDAVQPHKRHHVLATVHHGGAPEVERAIKAAAEAWQDWSRHGVAQFRNPHWLHPGGRAVLDSQLPAVKNALKFPWFTI